MVSPGQFSVSDLERPFTIIVFDRYANVETYNPVFHLQVGPNPCADPLSRDTSAG